MKTEKGNFQFTGTAHECKKIEFSFEFQKNSTYIEVDFDHFNNNEAKHKIGERTNWPDEPDYGPPEDWTWGGDSSESSYEIPSYGADSSFETQYDLSSLENPSYEDEGPESSYFLFSSFR